MNLDFSALSTSGKRARTYLNPNYFNVLAWIVFAGFAFALLNQVRFSSGFLLPLLAIALLTFVLFGWERIRKRDESNFAHFATQNGLSNKPIQSALPHTSFLYPQAVKHVYAGYVSGQWQKLPYQIFSTTYQRVSNDADSETEVFVLQIDLAMDVPHLFIDSRLNDSYVRQAVESNYKSFQKQNLEGDFNKYFDVYMAKEYEIEGLDILSTDVMALLMDKSLDIDVEIVDGYLFAYLPRPESMSTRQGYQILFELLEALADTLAHKKSVWRFAVIPRTPPKLIDTTAWKYKLASNIGLYVARSFWLIPLAILAAFIYILYRSLAIFI